MKPRVLFGPRRAWGLAAALCRARLASAQEMGLTVSAASLQTSRSGSVKIVPHRRCSKTLKKSAQAGGRRSSAQATSDSAGGVARSLGLHDRMVHVPQAQMKEMLAFLLEPVS